MSVTKRIQGDYTISTIDNDGNIIFQTDTLTIAGNLTVLGNTTNIQSNTTVYGDNELILNGNLASNASPLPVNSGIIVNRGISSNTALHYNETLGVWRLTNNGTLYGNISTNVGNVLYSNANSLSYYASNGDTLSTAGANLTWNGANTLTVTGNVNATNFNGPSYGLHTGNVSGLILTNTQPFINTLGNLTNVNVDGTTTSGELLILGNATIVGLLQVNTNVVSTSAGIFQGNADTGIEALYAGKSGFTFLPNVVAQFTTNLNHYTQLNIQNVNSGPEASGDIVITADNGDDTMNYLDLGLGSSGYNFSGFSAYYPNDGYLLIDGGNLLLNVEDPDKKLRIVVGDYDEANLTAYFDTTQLAVVRTTPAANVSSGAFTVAGGAGIAGNLYAGNVQGTTLTATNIVSTTGAFSGNVAVTGPVLTVPAGNTAQAPSGVAAGSVRYNSEYSSLEFYTGVSWVQTTVQVLDQVINPDGSSNTYTLSRSTTQSGILVMLNGVVQTPGVAYTVSGDQITFIETPLTTDNIQIRFISGGQTVTSDLVADPAPVYINTSASAVDTFDKTIYRTAKYLVQVSDSANVKYQSSEILVTHDGTNAFITTYNVTNTNGNISGFSVNVSGNNINLRGITTGGNCAVKLQKTYIKV